MGQLSKPLVPAGPVRTFYERLHRLHHEAGRPSMRELQRRTRSATRPRGINPTTIHDAFAAPRLARWDVVAEIVTQLGGPVEDFAELWRAAAAAGPFEFADTEAAVVPRELPPDVFAFTGRTTQLSELDGLVERTGAATVIAVVSGTAGVGKTALAVHWGHRVAGRFPDGQLYVDLRGYDPEQPLSPDEALAGLLRTLGVAGSDLPPRLAERTARYRSLLASRRVLVLLDNAHSADQVRPLLPGTPSCVVVVTSRDSLAGLVARDGARRVGLDLLPEPEAVALLDALVGDRVRAEPSAAATLAGRCARLPIALRVAAELAASRPAAPLSELAAELAAEPGQLSAGPDDRAAVRSVFSWSYRHLPAGAARLFRLLGAQPAHDWDGYVAAALLGTSLDEGRRLLDVLVRGHLVAGDRDRFGMHDLLRGYAATCAADEPTRTAALGRLIGYYLGAAAAAVDVLFPADRQRRPRVPEPQTPTPAPGDAELANLVAVTGFAAEHGWPDQAGQLAATLWPYLDNGGHYTEGAAVNGSALHAARATGDRVAESAALHNLGRIHWLWGRSEDALDSLRRALAIRREIGDRAGEGRTLGSLGSVYWRWGDYDEALRHHLQALEIRREIGDRSGEAIALGNVGVVHEAQGRYDDAIERYEQAVVIYQELGDEQGAGRMLGNLGVVFQARGHLDKAHDHYTQALAVARAFGDRLAEVANLANLGLLNARQGGYDTALDHLRAALAIAQEIDDREGEADIHANLGDVRRKQRRFDEAADHFTAALAMAQDIGDRRLEVSALNGQGEILRATGRPESAQHRHQAALALARDIGERVEQARALDGIAHCLAATGRPDAARDRWAAALSLYDALNVPEADEVRRHL